MESRPESEHIDSKTATLVHFLALCKDILKFQADSMASFCVKLSPYL